MSGPTQTCQACGRVETVRQDGRGFPPDIAKRRLRKRCKEAGCACDPQYRAGVRFGGPVTGMAVNTATPGPGNTVPQA
jgi:hypothetical protein